MEIKYAQIFSSTKLSTFLPTFWTTQNDYPTLLVYFQVHQYLAHIPEHDTESVGSVHSNADSGMGSNEEHHPSHQPGSPEKGANG